jgi:exopolysaccharide/PEP-CTERM locus tyrosine autokinase
MNKHSALRTSGSLLERAAEIYDFGAALRGAPAPRPEPEALHPQPETAPAPVEAKPAPSVMRAAKPEPAAAPARPIAREAPARRSGGRRGTVDREALREAGFVLPDAPVTGLAEEIRIIKRQLLLGANGKAGVPDEKRRSILICSAQPDEGKTFCAVNLALSLASEKDVEVLLVDGDFPKPEVLSILGLEGGAGLVDALADPALDPESLVIRTDVEGLSVLPAGRHLNDVTELLASERTREVLAALARADRRRLVIFDSPPALMASPASVLATHVGQTVLVVRADRTTEADLREAVALLSGCEDISLILNGAGFAANGRRFGSYYGYGQ